MKECHVCFIQAPGNFNSSQYYPISFQRSKQDPSWDFIHIEILQELFPPGIDQLIISYLSGLTVSKIPGVWLEYSQEPDVNHANRFYQQIFPQIWKKKKFQLDSYETPSRNTSTLKTGKFIKLFSSNAFRAKQLLYSII